MSAKNPAPDLSSAIEDVSTLAAPTRFVGRQPILDLQQRVFGYELLFRTSMDNRFAGDSADATRQMIDNVLLFGVETLAGKTKAFLNCTREALVERLATLLPAQSTVIEVLETVEVDDEVVAACVELKQQGFQIALDDYVPGRSSDLLVELADYIKLDFRACNAEQLASIQKSLAGVNASLIAEKVETQAEFDRAVIEGYRYFQGYFFVRPTILSSREVPLNQVVYIQLLCEISGHQTDMRQIERLIMSETSLCFRLLRLVNSAGMGMREEVKSVQHALLLIGEDQLRKMVSIALATAVGSNFSMPSELIVLALQRARFCELMTTATAQAAGEQYLIGLISVFDAILRMPMGKVLDMLPLRREVAGVLLGEDLPAGASLRIAESYEREDWTQCEELCRQLNLSETELSRMYVASLRWATQEIRNAGL